MSRQAKMGYQIAVLCLFAIQMNMARASDSLITWSSQSGYEDQQDLLGDGAAFGKNQETPIQSRGNAGIFTSLAELGLQHLHIDFFGDGNLVTATYNFGLQKSWQVGVGVSQYWTNDVSETVSDREYLSLILRYSF